MPLTIRKARPTDAPVMAGIHTRSWDAAYSGILPPEIIAYWNATRSAMWERLLAGPHDNYLAVRDEIPVGLLGLLVPCRDSDLCNTGEIERIYLDPQYWGQGIGHPLMEFAVKALRERGQSAAVLWVLEKNTLARRFYAKCGFHADGANKGFPDCEHIREMRYLADL